MRKNEQGITFIEVLVVSGILTVLFAFTYISLRGIKPTASFQTTLTTLVSDVRNQQLRAMTGDAQGGASASNYGIRFETDRYILFQGSTYSSLDTSNFVVMLDSNLEFSSITFLNNAVVFTKGVGDVVGYTGGANSLTLRNKLNNSTKTMQVNRLGVITSFN